MLHHDFLDLWYDTNVRGANVFAFDTDVFSINAAPTDGAAGVLPDYGYPITTKFVIQTAGWEDEDLPLQYRFQEVKSGDPEKLVSINTWSTDAFWTQVFGRLGTYTIQADARDTLHRSSVPVDWNSTFL